MTRIATTLGLLASLASLSGCVVAPNGYYGPGPGGPDYGYYNNGPAYTGGVYYSNGGGWNNHHCWRCGGGRW